jgi:predicted permease
MIRAKPDAIRAAFSDFDDRLASLPGIQAVSQSWGAIPLSGDDETLFWLEGQPKPTNDNDMNWAIDYIVEPGYLKAMGIPLLRGRFFTAQDDEHAPGVVVVDEIFAQKYFPNQDPIGKRINRGGPNGLAEIVGVVGHVNQWGLADDDKQSLRSDLYIPCLQMPDDFIAMAPSGSAVIVRSEGSSSAILDSIRHLNAQMSSQQVLFGAQTMDALVSDSVASRRFSMILLVVFAVLALVLAAVGIYGVTSYVVGQRTNEIGIRMALGAPQRDILLLILARGGKLAALGVAIGLAAALGLTRLMASLLYGVGAADPPTFAAVAVLLTMVALAACYIPARRAAKVDPIVALRYE